ncbi:MAG: LuxR C-terminal-related transcriptional regulator [Bacillota bacterium]|jgi:LuxR family maltose regulon positive regulatory protein
MQFKQRILKREHINRELRNIFDYPLTVVVAAMGYGKTTSVRNFLDEINARYTWISVESDEASAQYIWDSLTRQLAKTEPELGKQLNELGFPVDAPQRDKILKIIEDKVYLTRTVLVIDDYHFAHAPELDRLVEKIIKAKINGLHVLIISRTRPEMNIDELMLKGYCFLFKNDLFELSQDEIIAYFRLFNQDISPDTARQVYYNSEGWITAVYLITQRYCEIGRLEPGRNIESLIETAVMAHYTRKEAEILMSLSVLDSFTLQQAVFVTGDISAAGLLQKLSDSNSFIHYDERTENYKMHNIFMNFLKKKLEEQPCATERKDLYKRSGEWYLEKGDVLSGLRFLFKAEEYDLILIQFEKEGMTKVIDRAPRPIVELFKQIPLEVKYRHPIGYLVYAEFHLTSVDMGEGINLLDQIEQHYQADDLTSPELKKRIFGEIELLRSLGCFNDLRKMHKHQLKAYQLLDGSSSVMNKEMIFTFGSPHSLYLYYREKGEMQWTVDYLDVIFPYFVEEANGLGTGFEYTARAEYCLETGDYDQAELYAYKAIYKAQTMDQISLIICANLTLARLHLVRGAFDKAKELMADLNSMVVKYHNPILNCTLDLCTGYIGGILQEPHSFSDWLKSGNMEHSGILYQGMAFNYIVHGKAVLLEKNYIKLEVLAEEMYQLFSLFNNLLGFVHAHIIDAAAKYELYGLEKAKAALLPAIEIGRGDNILLPFVEYGIYILHILKALQKEIGRDEYLDKLAAAAAGYCTNLKRMDRGKSPADPLSGREREVLHLVIEGKTNREIATELYIAEVTVRKTITSIYRKLGVGGRAAAVKKALELKLV